MDGELIFHVVSRCSMLRLQLSSRTASVWLYRSPHVETTTRCESSSSVENSSETASFLLRLKLSHHLLLHRKWKPRLVEQRWAWRLQCAREGGLINAGKIRQQEGSFFFNPTIKLCLLCKDVFIVLLLLTLQHPIWNLEAWSEMAKDTIKAQFLWHKYIITADLINMLERHFYHPYVLLVSTNAQFTAMKLAWYPPPCQNASL